MNQQDFETRAKASFEREMADVRKACAILDTSTDYDTAYEQVRELYGEPLEVKKQGNPVRRIEILLSWGGPSSGYVLTVARGEALSGYYWFQDWFTEKRKFRLTSKRVQQVAQAYDLDLMLNE